MNQGKLDYYTRSWLKGGGSNLSFQVSWLVEGPEPGREHLDIDASSIQGTLMLAEGQR